MQKTTIKQLFWLFRTNLYISAFTFGGGYVVIPMVRKAFVQGKELFTEDELLDMAAVAQSSPGAIAINLSALAGYRTAGFLGAAVSCLGAVTPPLIILSVISSCYAFFRQNTLVAAVLKGMEAGVAALIVDTVVDMALTIFHRKNRFLSLLVPGAFLANFVFHINVIWVILASCMLCLAVYFVQKRRDRAC